MHSHNHIQKFKKALCVFVVPGNGQALLEMPDTAVLNLLKLNIDSIQVEIMSCKTNREQEAYKVGEGCTNINTVGIIKQKANGQNGQNQSNTFINYFYSSKNTEADKRERNTMTQKNIIPIVIFLPVLGALRAHFHYSLNPTASHSKYHQGMWHMHYRNHLRRNWSSYKNWTS